MDVLQNVCTDTRIHDKVRLLFANNINTFIGNIELSFINISFNFGFQGYKTVNY